MRVLADENIEAATVAWLRDSGHDVLWAAEEVKAAPDAVLLESARSASRVLLTRDRDFGELVFREHRVTAGIVLLRLRAKNQEERLSLLKGWWPDIEREAAGHYIVATNQRLRIRPLP